MPNTWIDCPDCDGWGYYDEEYEDGETLRYECEECFGRGGHHRELDPEERKGEGEMDRNRAINRLKKFGGVESESVPGFLSFPKHNVHLSYDENGCACVVVELKQDSSSRPVAWRCDTVVKALRIIFRRDLPMWRGAARVTQKYDGGSIYTRLDYQFYNRAGCHRGLYVNSYWRPDASEMLRAVADGAPFLVMLDWMLDNPTERHPASLIQEAVESVLDAQAKEDDREPGMVSLC